MLTEFRRGRRHRRLWILTSLATSLAGPALAVGEDQGRYTMSPTDGGLIRLDRETGVMSFCTGKEGAWSCTDMPESENGLKKRVEELEGEKRALEAERKLRDGPLGGPRAEAPPSGGPPPTGDTVPPVPPGNLPVPNERDVDQLFDYVEGMVKKFKERIDRLEKEAKKNPETPL